MAARARTSSMASRRSRGYGNDIINSGVGGILPNPACRTTPPSPLLGVAGRRAGLRHGHVRGPTEPVKIDLSDVRGGGTVDCRWDVGGHGRHRERDRRQRAATRSSAALFGETSERRPRRRAGRDLRQPRQGHRRLLRQDAGRERDTRRRRCRRTRTSCRRTPSLVTGARRDCRPTIKDYSGPQQRPGLH